MSSTVHTHLLVLRFSALGDVAMTVPVIKQLLDQHPDLSVTFVSEKKFEPLFKDIARLEFFGADIKGKHNGFIGLYQLFKHLKKQKKISAIADLHDVLRTKIISFFFQNSGYKIKKIDKGRKEKKELTRKQNKKIALLKTTFRRYADVFEKLDFPIKLVSAQKRVRLPFNSPAIQLSGENEKIKIGLAPFAKHREKMYPLENMEKVVEALIKKGYKIFLFGGGEYEMNQMNQWEQLYPGVTNIAAVLTFEEELALISNLDLMISMDSANMHLASLYGVPVASIWGATHPYMGFYGFGQNLDNIIQAELSCRPCSVFGNKKCYRGDWACMQMISPQMIIEKAEKIMQQISG